jgi:hypothetical protein
MQPRLRRRKSGEHQRGGHRILLARGMPQGRGKFVIDALALPAYLAKISETKGAVEKGIMARRGGTERNVFTAAWHVSEFPEESFPCHLLWLCYSGVDEEVTLGKQGLYRIGQ